MATDAGDDPAADPLDVDRAVEPHLERGVARDEARDLREAADVVGLLDGHEPEPAVDRHGHEFVATPEVRGFGGPSSNPRASSATRESPARPDRKRTGSRNARITASPIPPGPCCTVAPAGTSDATCSAMVRSAAVGSIGAGAINGRAPGTTATTLPGISGAPRSGACSSSSTTTARA